MTQEHTLARGEHTLAQHYQAQARRLASPLPAEDPLRAQLDELDQALEAGFSDLLADRFEALAGQVAQRQDPLAYLQQTPTGQRLHQQAAQRTQEQEALARDLGQRLQQSQEPAERLRLAAALRLTLREHLDLWSSLAAQGAADSLISPGALLSEHLEQLYAAPQAQEAPADAAPRAALPPSIATDRMLARADADAVRHYAAQPPGALLAPEGPEPSPEAQELLRTRVDRAWQQAPDATSRATLEALDQQMAAAARSYGASYVQATSQQAVADQPATLDLSALAQLRAELIQRRLEQARPDEQAALTQERDALMAQRAQLQSVSTGDGAAQRLLRDAQAELDRLADTQDEALAQTRQALARALAQAGQLESAAPAATPSLDQARQSLEERAQAFEQAASQRPDQPVTPTDLDQAVQQGAQAQQRSALSQLARRLWQRRAARPLSLPSLRGTRVFASDKAAMDPLYVGDAPRQVPHPDAQDTGMLGDVQRRTGRFQQAPTSTPEDPRMAMLGRSMARAIHQAARKSAGPSAGAANPLPGGTPAPRMASTPSNIFADTSSARMQQVYMPVLARMNQVGRASMPRAQRRSEVTMVKELASPEALYSVLLGEYGERLWREKPEIAKRLEASLKEVAQVLPASGSAGMTVLQKYTNQFRRNIESWLGGGQDSGPNQEKHEFILTPEAEAMRAVGEVMGGLEGSDTVDVNDKPADLIEQHSEEVERRLRIEKTTVDHRLLEKVSKITGLKPNRHVEAFRGPMAEQIAKEMGAKAFTVRNQMFLPQGADEALMAHEMVHAIEDNPSADPSQIQKEEMIAYGVQQEFQQGRERVDHAMQRAAERLELAKDTNRQPMKLSTEPGGVAGAPDRDPGGLVQQTNADRYTKERQILESISDAVEDLINYEESIQRERYGDF